MREIEVHIGSSDYLSDGDEETVTQSGVKGEIILVDFTEQKAA